MLRASTEVRWTTYCAEKLRSLLQQIPRNRNRWQDVYDICTYVGRAGFDRIKIARFFDAEVFDPQH